MFSTRQHTSFLLGLLVLVLVTIAPAGVYAKKTLGDATSALKTVSKETGIDEGEVTTIVGNGIASALTVVGLLFFVLMVYAGIKWMIAQGNDDDVTKARNTIIAAVIGLIVVVSAYAITNFITTNILEKGSGEFQLDPNVVGDPEKGEKMGCCISWTQPSVLSPSISSWKIMTEKNCKIFNEDLTFDPKNKNKFDHGKCPGPANGCWLWYTKSDPNECEAVFDGL